MRPRAEEEGPPHKSYSCGQMEPLTDDAKMGGLGSKDLHVSLLPSILLLLLPIGQTQREAGGHWCPGDAVCRGWPPRGSEQHSEGQRRGARGVQVETSSPWCASSSLHQSFSQKCIALFHYSFKTYICIPSKYVLKVGFPKPLASPKQAV